MIQVWVMKDVRRGYHTLNILSLMKKSSSLLTSLSIIKMKVINIRTVSNVPTRPVYLKYHVQMFILDTFLTSSNHFRDAHQIDNW